MATEMNRGRTTVALQHLAVGVFVLWIVYPLVGVVELATLPDGALLTGIVIPRSLTFGTIVRAWQFANLGTATANSAIVASAVTAGCLLLATLAGFAFGQFRFRGSSMIFFVFLLGMVVPLEAYLVPLYYQLRTFGLLDTRAGLVAVLLAQSLPFGVFWMRAAFRNIPQSIVEAATIDGAGSFTMLRFILAPLLRPAITTLVVLTFVSTWNDFLLSLVVVSTGSNVTAPLALALFVGQRNTDVTGLAAGALLISIPVVLVYVVFQRSLIRGILAGAVKA
jgi:raffinose/stachyose/melibiose transport system permease protein